MGRRGEWDNPSQSIQSGQLISSQASSRASHWRNEFRPPFQCPNIAGYLDTGGISCGDPTPNNEKELFGSSTYPYRCVAWLAAHYSFSPA
jgi:hypothetical protein